MPPHLELVSPRFEERVRRASAPNLRLMWNPSIAGSDIYWKTIPLIAPVKDDPCNALEWIRHEGQLEDTGSLELAWDMFPADLPAEGCDVAFMVQRRVQGRLGDGIQGDLHASAFDGTLIRLVP